MTFERLNLGDWVAWLAALALIGSLALDWYGTAQGDEARRIERLIEPGQGPVSGEVTREAREDARNLAEREERNGLDPHGPIDVLILIVLLAAAALALAAAFLRAAGRRFAPPRTPSAAAAAAGAALAVLLAYRIVQEPGLDAATTVKGGTLLALVAAAALALGARTAARAEVAGTAWRTPRAERAAAAGDPEVKPHASNGTARAAGAPDESAEEAGT